MEIASGVHHFTDHRFNWYLVEESQQITVIDTGFPGHYRLIRWGLESIGRSIRDISAIVITHAHADHTGAAARLSRESGASVHVHPGDRRLVRRPLYLPWRGLLGNAWRPYTGAMIGHAIGHGLLRMRTIRDCMPVHDKQTLDAPGSPHIIHVPGHTPGDIVVHLPERGVLFTGDALVTRHLLTGRDGNPQVTSPSLNRNYPEAVDSLRAMSHLGQVTLLPGHGRPWTGDAAQAVTQAVALAGGPVR